MRGVAKQCGAQPSAAGRSLAVRYPVMSLSVSPIGRASPAALTLPSMALATVGLVICAMAPTIDSCVLWATLSAAVSEA